MFKETLMTALRKAADYHNSGLSDNDAVVKSAAEHGFNADQASRLVETYNTAKTICFYKTAEDRSGLFPLADAGQILKELFRNAPASKTAGNAVLHDYGCYDAPMNLVEVGETMPAEEYLKAAAAEPDRPMDDHCIRSIDKQIDDYRKLAEDARISAVTADDEYRMAVYALAKELEKTGHASEGLAAMDGIRYAAVKKDVASYFGQDVKDAAEKVLFTSFDVDNPEVMALYGSVCDVAEKQAQCLAVADTFLKIAEDMEAVVRRSVLGADEENFFSDRVRGLMAGGYEVKVGQQGVAGGRGGGGGGASIMDPVRLVSQSMGKGMGSALQDSTAAAMTEAMAGGAETKALTERAKNLHRKFILEKLITTDPVLRGLPEEDVVGAYQTLVQLAPEVSLNEDVSRSILRAATSTSGSAIAPYDAKTFVDLDSAIKAQLEQAGGKKRKTEMAA